MVDVTLRSGEAIKTKIVDNVVLEFGPTSAATWAAFGVGSHVADGTLSLLSVSGNSDNTRTMSLSGNVGQQFAFYPEGKVTIGEAEPAAGIDFNIEGTMSGDSVDLQIGLWIDCSTWVHHTAGCVGFGTQAPQSNADISGDLRISTCHSGSAELGSYKFIGCDDAGAVVTYGALKGTAQVVTGGSEIGGVVIQTIQGGALTDSVTITDCGVGIGTTCPSQNLDVQGGIRFGAAGANNIIHTSAAAGAAGTDLYWGDQILLDAGNVSSYAIGSIVAGDGTCVSNIGGAYTICATIGPGDVVTCAMCCIISSTGIGGGGGPGNVVLCNTSRGSSQNIYKTVCVAGSGSCTFTGNCGVLHFSSADANMCVCASSDVVMIRNCCAHHAATFCAACCILSPIICVTGTMTGNGLQLTGITDTCSTSGGCYIFVKCFGTYASKVVPDGRLPRSTTDSIFDIYDGDGAIMFQGRAHCDPNQCGWGINYHWCNVCFTGSLCKQSGSFLINHPCCSKENPNKFNTKQLIHSIEEGPKHGVFYEGKAKLENGIATVELPGYFQKLVHKKELPLIQLTSYGEWAPIFAGDPEEPVNCGVITVKTVPCGKQDAEFYWRVSATRGDSHIMDHASNTDEHGLLITDMWKNLGDIENLEEELAPLTLDEVKDFAYHNYYTSRMKKYSSRVEGTEPIILASVLYAIDQAQFKQDAIDIISAYEDDGSVLSIVN